MDRRFQSFSLTTQVSEFSYYLYDGLLNLLLIFWNNNLTRIFFENESKHYFQYFSKMKCQEDTGRDLVELTKQQFDEYFSGKPMDFELPMILCGTYFQNRVWKAASKICFGNVRSYAKIAKDIGSPKATRAVGGALGRNPIPIIIPCHRVIESNGSLGGFSGDLLVKKTLLAIEGISTVELTI